MNRKALFSVMSLLAAMVATGVANDPYSTRLTFHPRGMTIKQRRATPQAVIAPPLGSS